MRATWFSGVDRYRHYRKSEVILRDISSSWCQISLPEDYLHKSFRVVCRGELICIDTSALIVRHSDHSDPLHFVQSDDGMVDFQVCFYRQSGFSQAPDFISIIADDSARRIRCSSAVKLEAGEPIFDPGMEIKTDGSDRLVVSIDSDRECEVIFQMDRFGIIREDRVIIPAGLSELKSPKLSGLDHFGICLSTTSGIAASESKHMIMGQFGAPTSRMLLHGPSRSILLPPIDFEPIFRGFLAFATTMEELDWITSQKEFRSGYFGEIVLGTDLWDVGYIGDCLLTTVTSCNADDSSPLLLNPRNVQESSYPAIETFLFGMSRHDDCWSSRKNAAETCHNNEVHILESAWFNATYQPKENNIDSFGVSFSVP